MKTVVIASVVAGHGEVASLPILLRRIATEMVTDVWFEALQPIRQPQQRLVSNKEETLTKAIRLAQQKLAHSRSADAQKAILVLVDAEQGLPCIIAPQMLSVAQQSGAVHPVICVVANVEFETWFVASAASLTQFLDLSEGVPEGPEVSHCGKRWISSRFTGGRYSETVDQPRLTAKFDLRMCRSRSPSFDKLCRELAAL